MSKKNRKFPRLSFFIFLTLGNYSISIECLDDFNAIDFLKDVQRMHGFQNILFMQNRNATMAREFVYSKEFNDLNDEELAAINGIENEISENYSKTFLEQLMLEIKESILQFNELVNSYLKKNFNDQMMSVICIDGEFEDHRGLLKNLAINLRHMTLSKVLFLINFNEDRVEILEKLFLYCWKQKIINVVALFKDYQSTEKFYSYTKFPQYSLIATPIAADVMRREEIYPYRLGNLKGYKLPLIIGGSDPRIIVHLDEKNKMIVNGFVGHFLRAFERKYNCQMYEPLPAKIDAFAPAQQLIAAVRNGTVQISAGLTFPTIPMVGYTYPYEQLNWCVMMPVEPDIPGYEFYTIVFELRAFLMTLATIVIISMVLSAALHQHGYKIDFLFIFLHKDCLRGILGQPFTEVSNAPLLVRFIYLQICVLGILLTTSYNAYFATYVTSAPKEDPLKNFNDILRSGIKVYAWSPEFEELVGRVQEFRRYVPMFHLENNYKIYLEMRDSFNDDYGYMMPTTKWHIINEQQKIFTSPIFKRSEDLCFFNSIPMCFPVHENSIFMQTLYQLILETAQSGLTDYWQKIGFLEMIIAGKLTFADLSRPRSFEAMEAEDLFYIWYGLAFMGILASLVFLGELIMYHRKRWRKFMRRIFISKFFWGNKRR